MTGPPPPPPQLLVDGELRAAADGSAYPVIEPATGREIAQAPDGRPADADAAVTAAHRAFHDTDWAADHAGRIAALRAFHQALVDHGPVIRALVTEEAGVPVSLTTGPQYGDPVRRFGEVLHRRDGRRATGVVAAITPWCAPVQLALDKVGPALAAGDTVVLKPAADTPWVAAELGRLAADHLPPGVLNVVTTRDVDVAITLTTDPRVDLVDFTGSEVNAERVRSQAAKAREVRLDHGSRPPTAMPEGAGFGAGVARAALSVCRHAGQDCAAFSRILVPRARYDEAVEVAATTMSAVVPGDPADPATICGPVISAVHRDRVLRYLALARQEGGAFVTGGRAADRDAGFWIEPTVIAGLDASARAAREEIFGPVLIVLPQD